jgi:hypothetical protein
MYRRRAGLEAIPHFEELGMSQAPRNAKWQKDQGFYKNKEVMMKK